MHQKTFEFAFSSVADKPVPFYERDEKKLPHGSILFLTNFKFRTSNKYQWFVFLLYQAQAQARTKQLYVYEIG